jgi:hypothetical protein
MLKNPLFRSRFAFAKFFEISAIAVQTAYLAGANWPESVHGMAILQPYNLAPFRH